jgi:hypothetical protein
VPWEATNNALTTEFRYSLNDGEITIGRLALCNKSNLLADASGLVRLGRRSKPACIPGF